MGATNVVALDKPAELVNNGVASAISMRYPSLDDIKRSRWFHDAKVGALILMLSPAPENCDMNNIAEYVVRLYDFSKWKRDLGEEEFSPATVLGAKSS